MDINAPEVKLNLDGNQLVPKRKPGLNKHLTVHQLSSSSRLLWVGEIQVYIQV